METGTSTLKKTDSFSEFDPLFRLISNNYFGGFNNEIKKN